MTTIQIREPNFGERAAAMKRAADDLRVIAELVADEAIRMAAAEKRFAERRGHNNRKASR